MVLCRGSRGVYGLPRVPLRLLTTWHYAGYIGKRDRLTGLSREAVHDGDNLGDRIAWTISQQPVAWDGRQ